MDVQVKAGSLVRTIGEREIFGIDWKIVSQLQSEMTSVVSNFVAAGISAAGMHKLENLLAECTRESSRKILQWLVTNVEHGYRQRKVTQPSRCTSRIVCTASRGDAMSVGASKGEAPAIVASPTAGSPSCRFKTI